MQKELILNLQHLIKSKLDVGQYLLLKMIYEGVDLKQFNINMLEQKLALLQRDLWIKLFEDDSIEPRDKLIKLFESNNIDKDIDEILTYLKIKAKYSNRFSIKTAAHRKFVNARLSEGNSVEDLKAVIDMKCQEWMGNDMEQFLQPSTLFNATKFNNYLIALDKFVEKKNVSLNKMI